MKLLTCSIVAVLTKIIQFTKNEMTMLNFFLTFCAINFSGDNFFFATLSIFCYQTISSFLKESLSLSISVKFLRMVANYLKFSDSKNSVCESIRFVEISFAFIEYCFDIHFFFNTIGAIFEITVLAYANTEY